MLSDIHWLSSCGPLAPDGSVNADGRNLLDEYKCLAIFIGSHLAAFFSYSWRSGADVVIVDDPQMPSNWEFDVAVMSRYFFFFHFSFSLASFIFFIIAIRVLL